MREIVTEVELNAAPDKVWAVIADIPGWEDWNSTIYTASGTAGPGAKLDIAMKGPGGGAGPRYAPVITEWEPGRKLRWRAKMGFSFLFTNEKEITLSGGGGVTKMVHKELFSGLLVKLFWEKMKTGVPPILEAMKSEFKGKSGSVASATKKLGDGMFTHSAIWPYIMATTTSLWTYLQNNLSNNVMPSVPGQLGLPFLGDTLNALWDPWRILNEKVDDYGPVFKIRAFGEIVVIMLSAEANKFVLIDEAESFSNEKGWDFVIGDLFKKGYYCVTVPSIDITAVLCRAPFRNER